VVVVGAGVVVVGAGVVVVGAGVVVVVCPLGVGRQGLSVCWASASGAEKPAIPRMPRTKRRRSAMVCCGSLLCASFICFTCF
jgi:hypothetical protein